MTTTTGKILLLILNVACFESYNNYVREISLTIFIDSSISITKRKKFKKGRGIHSYYTNIKIEYTSKMSSAEIIK